MAGAPNHSCIGGSGCLGLGAWVCTGSLLAAVWRGLPPYLCWASGCLGPGSPPCLLHNLAVGLPIPTIRHLEKSYEHKCAQTHTSVQTGIHRNTLSWLAPCSKHIISIISTLCCSVPFSIYCYWCLCRLLLWFLFCVVFFLLVFFPLSRWFSVK